MPGEFAADESIVLENATLKARVSQLEADLLIASSKSNPALAENLAGGADKFSSSIGFLPKGEKGYRYENISVSWDNVLAYVGPTLLGECTQDEFEEKIKLCFYHGIIGKEEWKEIPYPSVAIPYVVTDAIMVQLRALGFMTHGTKRRAVADQKVYWKLSDQGEARLIQIQALKKPEGTRSGTGNRATNS